eukprot:4318247-Amphidinium_carterae.2
MVAQQLCTTNAPEMSNSLTINLQHVPFPEDLLCHGASFRHHKLTFVDVCRPQLYPQCFTSFTLQNDAYVCTNMPRFEESRLSAGAHLHWRMVSSPCLPACPILDLVKTLHHVFAVRPQWYALELPVVELPSRTVVAIIQFNLHRQTIGGRGGGCGRRGCAATS